jgi:beta-galactosidase
VDLPHDWSIEDLPDSPDGGPFHPEAVGGRSTGYTVGGVGWYRKRFAIPSDQQGKRVRLQFDGVYMNADVWLNGEHLGDHPYGYTAFWFDLTPHVNFGSENVLAVRVRNVGRNTRWYSGSGIYRHVWLTVTDPIHVAQWGTYVTTPEVSAESATVRIQTKVWNATDRAEAVTLRTRIVDGQGGEVAQDESQAEVPTGESLEFDQTMSVSRPALWSPDSPTLYEAVSEIEVSGSVVDELVTTFGIRSISFDSENGFLLNGEPTLLQGACMHHDNGPLGACAYDRAEERRVELMRNSGYNAVRTAHNPPSSAFLDACDRLGMLIIDEAFDQWRQKKNAEDYHLYFDEWWQRDVESILLRDRNHPCVIMWSTGNEIPERYMDEGVETGQMLADYMRQLDPTRPVTAGVNGPSEKADGMFGTLDVCGYNYAPERYAEDLERMPDRVIYASEAFPLHAFAYWMAVLDHPHVIGDCVWTGYDYLGEATIGWQGWEGKRPDVYPWTAAYCGDIDICGFKLPASYYRDVLWGSGARVSAFVHSPEPTFGTEMKSPWGWHDVHASWNWPGCDGKELTVDVYSAYEEVKLLLNGQDLGTKATSRETSFMATWDVPYEPGTLRAVGYEDGEPVAEWELQTAGEPDCVRLTPDRDVIKADGQDLCYLVVELLDADGVRHPTAENLVRVQVEGEGQLAAIGNSNPMSTESFQQPQRKAYEGRCLVIVKSTAQAGMIRVTAEANGLKPAQVTIETQE